MLLPVEDQVPVFMSCFQLKTKVRQTRSSFSATRAEVGQTVGDQEKMMHDGVKDVF